MVKTPATITAGVFYLYKREPSIVKNVVESVENNIYSLTNNYN